MISPEHMERMVKAFESIAESMYALYVNGVDISVNIAGPGPGNGHNLCLDLSASLDNIANAIRDATNRSR